MKANINGHKTTIDGDRQEILDEFKRQCINKISALTLEDDPHVILILGEGHDDGPEVLSTACAGFLVKAGMILLKHASEKMEDDEHGDEN